jgi:hypothetical protein
MENNLLKGLGDYAPEIAARFKLNVEYMFGRMVEALGEDLKGVHNSWAYCKQWSETVRPIVKCEYPDNPNAITHSPRDRRIYSIDAEKMEKAAAQYAKDTINTWKIKILAKLETLENVEVEHLTGLTFRIYGTRQGRKIEIQQEMIINCSKNGKLFNQFPALIYVDGKRKSEKKYKEMFN